MVIYPEDLFPHPATFYDAMANGCAIVATPFKAAVQRWTPALHRAADVVSRQLVSLVWSLVDVQGLLDGMQRAAHDASRNTSRQHAGQSFFSIIHPLIT